MADTPAVAPLVIDGFVDLETVVIGTVGLVVLQELVVVVVVGREMSLLVTDLALLAIVFIGVVTVVDEVVVLVVVDVVWAGDLVADAPVVIRWIASEHRTGN